MELLMLLLITCCRNVWVGATQNKLLCTHGIEETICLLFSTQSLKDHRWSWELTEQRNYIYSISIINWTLGHVQTSEGTHHQEHNVPRDMCRTWIKITSSSSFWFGMTSSELGKIRNISFFTQHDCGSEEFCSMVLKSLLIWLCCMFKRMSWAVEWF